MNGAVQDPLCSFPTTGRWSLKMKEEMVPKSQCARTLRISLLNASTRYARINPCIRCRGTGGLICLISAKKKVLKQLF